MQTTARSDTALICGLLFLCLIPLIAGVLRVTELLEGAVITPENARFFEKPTPIVLHVMSSLVFCIVGAFQFSSSIRRKHSNWHRNLGTLLIPCGLTSALSGLWMAHFYPSLPYDSPSLYVVRIVASIAMAVFICLASFEILKRNIRAHRAWIMRGYALGLGAGTQVLAHIPWFIFPDIRSEIARTIFMAAGWGINLLVVEWILYQENRRALSNQIKS